MSKQKKISGFLITLEGGEGGGKTTLAARLRQHFAAINQDVVFLREPGGTAISEQIREIVLSPKNTNIAFTTEVLLFQASRAQIYHEMVLPALESGKVVIMDRSRDSSVVYQGIVRDFGRKLIDQLNNISTKNTLPDLTILLDVPVEIGLNRKTDSQEMNRLDMEAKHFHQQVRDAYLQLASEDKTGRWAVINASQDLESVDSEAWRLILAKLPK
jgi:dTMP kinase